MNNARRLWACLLSGDESSWASQSCRWKNAWAEGGYDHIKISNYCPKTRPDRRSCVKNRPNDLITSGLSCVIVVTCFASRLFAASIHPPDKEPNRLLKAIKNQKNLVIYSSIDCSARSRPLIPFSFGNETEVISGSKIWISFATESADGSFILNYTSVLWLEIGFGSFFFAGFTLLRAFCRWFKSEVAFDMCAAWIWRVVSGRLGDWEIKLVEPVESLISY